MRAALFRTALDDPCSVAEENYDNQDEVSKRFEFALNHPNRLDVVIAAYKRSASTLLKHLDKCLPPSARVYIYAATDIDRLINESGIFKK